MTHDVQPQRDIDRERERERERDGEIERGGDEREGEGEQGLLLLVYYPPQGFCTPPLPFIQFL